MKFVLVVAALLACALAGEVEPKAFGCNSHVFMTLPTDNPDEPKQVTEVKSLIKGKNRFIHTETKIDGTVVGAVFLRTDLKNPETGLCSEIKYTPGPPPKRDEESCVSDDIDCSTIELPTFKPFEFTTKEDLTGDDCPEGSDSCTKYENEAGAYIILNAEGYMLQDEEGNTYKYGEPVDPSTLALDVCGIEKPAPEDFCEADVPTIPETMCSLQASGPAKLVFNGATTDMFGKMIRVKDTARYDLFVNPIPNPIATLTVRPDVIMGDDEEPGATFLNIVKIEGLSLPSGCIRRDCIDLGRYLPGDDEKTFERAVKDLKTKIVFDENNQPEKEFFDVVFHDPVSGTDSLVKAEFTYDSWNYDYRHTEQDNAFSFTSEDYEQTSTPATEAISNEQCPNLPPVRTSSSSTASAGSNPSSTASSGASAASTPSKESSPASLAVPSALLLVVAIFALFF